MPAPTPMKSVLAPALLALGLGLAGCQSAGVRARNAELGTGPRFDEKGTFTDRPSVTIPLWNSEGIKDRPLAVTPSRDRTMD